MPRELTPELHDIGKLAPSRFRHTFDDFDFAQANIKATSRTWAGIRQHHHGRQDKYYPTDRETFLLAVADALAATCSRLPSASRPIGRHVKKLWNPESIPESHDIEAEELATFVEQDPPANEFFARFTSHLERRAEDAKANVTSLRTHCELVGKFYRFLCARYAHAIPDITSKTRGQVSQAIEVFKSQNTLTLARCAPRFSILPFRARDLGIFLRQRRLIQEVTELFPDRVLFSTAQEVLLISDSTEILERFAAVFVQSGFWLESSHGTSAFSMLSRDLDLIDVLGSSTTKTTHYPPLDRTISPPLCEACRMHAAVRRWREGDREDLLCGTCYDIRDEGASLQSLAEWTGKVAWVHITLDIEALLKTLRDLFAKHLASSGVSESPEIRFSLLAEFQRDYDDFLKEMEVGISSLFGKGYVEVLLPNLYCVRLGAEREIMHLLRIHDEGVGRFFPEFRETQISPMRLGISVSAAKIPFFEHWGVIKEQAEDVLVNIIGGGAIRASLKALPHILTVATMPNRSALHKLAQVANISEGLAMLKMHDRADTNAASHRLLRDRLLPFGLNYQSLLTLARILGD